MLTALLVLSWLEDNTISLVSCKNDDDIGGGVGCCCRIDRNSRIVSLKPAVEFRMFSNMSAMLAPGCNGGGVSSSVIGVLVSVLVLFLSFLLPSLLLLLLLSFFFWLFLFLSELSMSATGTSGDAIDDGMGDIDDDNGEEDEDGAFCFLDFLLWW